MFLRVVRAAGRQGIKREYVRVVEAYRQNGKTRHCTVLNLGRRDLLAAHLDLDKLTRLLHGDAVTNRAVRHEDVGAVAAWDWGPMLVAGHLWRELGLEATLDRLAAPARREAAPLSDRVLVLACCDAPQFAFGESLLRCIFFSGTSPRAETSRSCPEGSSPAKTEPVSRKRALRVSGNAKHEA